MITITQAVQQILSEDGFVTEAMQRGLINTSAYAKEIHSRVENITMKPVKIGTIVVALSRIGGQARSGQPFNPSIAISGMTVTTSLCELTYEATQTSREQLRSLSKQHKTQRDFTTITEGLHEITIILSENAKEEVLNHFTEKPQVVISDLVAISVRFSADYIEVPNTIYSLVGALALRHINLMEIVSTYTELTFIVFEKEMEQTIQALNVYAKR